MIALRDVSFAYDAARPVLRNVGLEIRAGERIGLTGPNGSGKTTLLHLIVGLVRPSSGEVVCFGERRTHESDFLEVRRRVGLLFQDSDDQLFCPTVGEDVAFGPLNLGKSRGETESLVRRALEAVGLLGYEQRVTYKLSGGEKRLVALATVLAMEPDVLLLDEPMTGLDAEHEQRVRTVLEQLPQAQLIVAHNRDFIDAATQRRVALSHNGTNA